MVIAYNNGNIEQKVSQKIKSIRQAKRLDQKTLAQRAGLTRSYISLLETGRKTAAISTLSRIADALGVALGEFFEDTDNLPTPSLVITRSSGTLSSSEKSAFGYKYIPLCREKRNKSMDPFLVRIEAGTSPKHTFVHSGEEFNIVFEGRLKLSYGHEEYILEAGDSVYFDSSVPHRFESIGESPAYLISVNSAELSPALSPTTNSKLHKPKQS